MHSRTFGFSFSLGLIAALGVAGAAIAAAPTTPVVTAAVGRPAPQEARPPTPLGERSPTGAVLRVRSPTGVHVRVATERGPIHVWRPAGYDARSGGVVLYVHGYYTDVDRAWDEHGLERQFLRSGRNALFICPEAPAGANEAVRWTRLDELLATVERLGGLSLPRGPVAAVAHSGGFRTIMYWLSAPRLTSVTLLDGLYGQEAPFLEWLRAVEPSDRRLLLVTTTWTDRIRGLVAPVSPRVELPSIPEGGLPAELAARAGLHVYRSQYGHMELVAEGRALPVLVAASGVPGV